MRVLLFEGEGMETLCGSCEMAATTTRIEVPIGILCCYVKYSDNNLQKLIFLSAVGRFKLSYSQNKSQS